MTKYAANVAVSLKGAFEAAMQLATRANYKQVLEDSRQYHQCMLESVETKSFSLELEVLKHLGIDHKTVDFEASTFHIVSVAFTTIAEVLASNPTKIENFWYEYGEFCPLSFGFSDVTGIEVRYYPCPQVELPPEDRRHRRGLELFVFFLDGQPAFMGRQGAYGKEQKWVISHEVERRLWDRVRASQEDPTEVVDPNQFLEDLVYV